MFRSDDFVFLYHEQLKTSDWIKRKSEILELDDYKCFVCGCDNSDGRLEVHHVMYIDDLLLWKYPNYLLVTLCRKHHQEEHDKQNIHRKEVIEEWMIKLFLRK